MKILFKILMVSMVLVWFSPYLLEMFTTAYGAIRFEYLQYLRHHKHNGHGTRD